MTAGEISIYITGITTKEPSITQAVQALLCHQYTKHTLCSSIPEIWKPMSHLLAAPDSTTVTDMRHESPLRPIYTYSYHHYPSVGSLRTLSPSFLCLHLNHTFPHFDYSSTSKKFPMKRCKQYTRLYCGTSNHPLNYTSNRVCMIPYSSPKNLTSRLTHHPHMHLSTHITLVI
jgi:hypothetical protein